MLEEVERWLSRRSWSAAERPIERILAAKQRTGTTVSVVLPALDEEATVGDIVAAIRRELMTDSVPLVDELVVIDSGSTDRTAEVAAKAGARVVHRDAILPRIPALPGKGEVLWRSLLVTSGDVVCFIDADLKDFDAGFVSGIVGPLLTDPDVDFVKAMYDRPFGADSPFGETASQGAGSPSSWRGRCSTSTGPNWPELSSRWAASTRPGAHSWSGCRSRRVRSGARAARRRAAHGGPRRAGPGRRGRTQAPPPGRAGARPDGRRDLPHRAAEAVPGPSRTARADPVRAR